MAWILAQGLDALEANTRYQLVQQELHENKLQAL